MNNSSDTSTQGYIDRLTDIASKEQPTKTDLEDLARIKANSNQAVQNALFNAGFNK